MHDSRSRIVRAAAELLVQGGRAAVSTRAVSAAAGVQAPAIYRQHGDMQALLQAAAYEVLAAYVRQKKTSAPAADPVEALREGWDLHLAFGLANPDAYVLLYAEVSAAAAEAMASKQREGLAHLETLVTRVAAAGRLRVSVPHAVAMISAAGRGATLTLVSTPTAERDLQLSTSMREAVLAAIIVPAKSKGRTHAKGDQPGRVAPRAIALRTVLGETGDGLSSAEKQLLGEWLDRLAASDEPKR